MNSASMVLSLLLIWAKDSATASVQAWARKTSNPSKTTRLSWNSIILDIKWPSSERKKSKRSFFQAPSPGRRGRPRRSAWLRWSKSGMIWIGMSLLSLKQMTQLILTPMPKSWCRITSRRNSKTTLLLQSYRSYQNHLVGISWRIEVRSRGNSYSCTCRTWWSTTW